VGEQSLHELRVRVEARSQELIRDLQEPNLESLRAFVFLIHGCVGELNQTVEMSENQGGFLRASVLQSAFPALAWYRRGNLDQAAEWIFRTWQSQALTFSLLSAPDRARLLGQLGPAVWDGPIRTEEREQEFLAGYNLAVAELLASQLKDAQARLILRRMMAYLGLSLDHLARIFDVSSETIRLWERGKSEVPNSLLSELLLADTALHRLLEIFRPERLAQVIRRKNDLFERDQALDWILRGRLADVADRYEEVLAYQV